MGRMRDGETRGMVENLQDVIKSQAEKLVIETVSETSYRQTATGCVVISTLRGE